MKSGVRGKTSFNIEGNRLIIVGVPAHQRPGDSFAELIFFYHCICIICITYIYLAQSNKIPIPPGQEGCGDDARHYGAKLTLSDMGRSGLDNQVLPYIHSRECHH